MNMVLTDSGSGSTTLLRASNLNYCANFFAQPAELGPDHQKMTRLIDNAGSYTTFFN
jgi:hypothetical protein